MLEDIKYFCTFLKSMFVEQVTLRRWYLTLRREIDPTISR